MSSENAERDVAVTPPIDDEMFSNGRGELIYPGELNFENESGSSVYDKFELIQDDWCLIDSEWSDGEGE